MESARNPAPTNASTTINVSFVDKLRLYRTKIFVAFVVGVNLLVLIVVVSVVSGGNGSGIHGSDMSSGSSNSSGSSSSDAVSGGIDNITSTAANDSTSSATGAGNSTASVSAECAVKAWESSAKDGRATWVTDHINCIKLSTATLTVPPASTSNMDSFTSEEKALAWLIHDDPLQLSPDSESNQFRLQQRYALLTLLLQFPTLAATSLNESECEWTIVAGCASPSASTEPPTTMAASNVVTDIVTSAVSTLPGSTLSPDLGLLSHLVTLNVEAAGLMGRLSTALSTTSSWTNLKRFDVHGNAFTGSLPTNVLMAWTNLEQFEVFNNALTGSLSSLLGTSWTNLDMFDVGLNDLTGNLPPSLGATWTNLEMFRVADNALTGTVPNLASSWSKLHEAFFYNNNFVGNIPNGFCTNATTTVLWADCTEVLCTCCDMCY